MDSDSDSGEETDHIAALSGEVDSDMELDEPDQRSVSMTTGITHDHPYAWALDGRVASLNEGNNLPGHIHVSVKIKTRISQGSENDIKMPTPPSFPGYHPGHLT